jgi:hypothetical protein
MPDKKEKVVWCFDGLEEQAVDWLWPGRLPAGKLTLIDGDPSQGKSLMTLDLASRFTAQRPMPDGHAPPEPLSVVLVGSEDGIRDTVLPRLNAGGADLRRVHAFAGRAQNGVWNALPSFPEDCDLLIETLRETKARLVIVDPLMAFLSTRACSQSDQLVRRALTPLAHVAEETQAAILLVRHLNKGTRSSPAMYRGSGSIAIIGAARMAYLVGKAPDDTQLQVLAPTKSNLATTPESLGFRIAGNDAGQPVVVWGGPVEISADDLVLTPRSPRGEELTRAEEFLKEQLRDGPCSRETLIERAREAGVADMTMRRAKKTLGIEAVQLRSDGQRCWLWKLTNQSPDESLPDPEKQKRDLERAQAESDELMATLRERYVGKLKEKP